MQETYESHALYVTRAPAGRLNNGRAEWGRCLHEAKNIIESYYLLLTCTVASRSSLPISTPGSILGSLVHNRHF